MNDLAEDKSDPFPELEQSVYSALETYSNVHRGSGYKSIVTTDLYDRSRGIVLDYLGLDKKKYHVVFSSPGRAEILVSRIKPGKYHILSSNNIGLPVGIRALAIEKKAMPAGAPAESGGGTARLISARWVIWAKGPEKLEAGTPPIINVIAFVNALRILQKNGTISLLNTNTVQSNAGDILHKDNFAELSGLNLLEELRKSIIGHNINVSTGKGRRRYINLDNGASTPAFEPVWNAVSKTWRQPENVHREIINEVKSVCADFLNAPQSVYEIIFTSNATEAINLAALSFSRESEKDTEPVVLNTLLEHTSNELPWRMAKNTSMIRLDVNNDGLVDLKELDSVLRAYNLEGKYGRKRIKIAAISGASNVLGIFNDLEEIGRIVHRYGVRLMVDAAQMVSHRKVEMERCGIDYLAFSAHKVYAPFGTGVLVARKGILSFSSSELEHIKSSGEENAAGIAALGKALLLLQRTGMDLIMKEEQALTARALLGLASVPGLTIYGIKDPGSPEFARKGGVIVFSLKSMWPDKLAKTLSEKSGIGVRYGCHCAHLLVKHILKVPKFLEQFQGLMLTLLPKISLPGVVRISLGIENTESDIDIFLKEINAIAEKK
jgi:selenocysteine lyase/cysteine desulfurase